MKIKYPKTPHFAWSEGLLPNDKIITDLSGIAGKEIVITEKMDGENCTMMHDCIYFGNLDSSDHPSRQWVKDTWNVFKKEIPEEWRICGENLYMHHTVFYPELPDYFMVFSIWDERNVCLSFDETLEWCSLLGLKHVPVLWRGMFDENFVKAFSIDTESQEGYVVRIANEFPAEAFATSVGKYVTKEHVSDDNELWMHKKVVKNELK